MAMGAHVLDVGAESTRPGSEAVSPDEEYQRLENFLKFFCVKYDFPLSIDTRKYEVMEALLSEPVFRERIYFFNDVEAFQDEAKLDLIAKHDKDSPTALLKLIAMHSKGGIPPLLKSSEIPDDFYSIDYPNLNSEQAALKQSLIDFFSHLFKRCLKYQIEVDRLILDPGLGFGKNVYHSLALIEIIPDLVSLFKRDILIGASRKSFLKAALQNKAGLNVLGDRLDHGTVAENTEMGVPQHSHLDLLTEKYNQLCYKAGARYFRVHELV